MFFRNNTKSSNDLQMNFLIDCQGLELIIDYQIIV